MECGRLKKHCVSAIERTLTKGESLHARDTSRLCVLEPGESPRAQTATVVWVQNHLTQTTRKMTFHSFPVQGPFPAVILMMWIGVYIIYFPCLQLKSVGKNNRFVLHSEACEHTGSTSPPGTSNVHSHDFIFCWWHTPVPNSFSKPISKGDRVTSICNSL